jgi:ABC-type long-subunit fatty acid transport system fused permease/ATPase subunit
VVLEMRVKLSRFSPYFLFLYFLQNGAVMVVDTVKLEALAEELAPRWERTFSIHQIRSIMMNEQYQNAVEKGINVYHLSELEAWNKALSMAFHRSI